MKTLTQTQIEIIKKFGGWHIPEIFPDVARWCDGKCSVYVDTAEKEIRFFSEDIEEYVTYNPTIPLIDQPESTLEKLLNLK